MLTVTTIHRKQLPLSVLCYHHGCNQKNQISKVSYTGAAETIQWKLFFPAWFWFIHRYMTLQSFGALNGGIMSTAHCAVDTKVGLHCRVTLTSLVCHSSCFKASGRPMPVTSHAAGSRRDWNRGASHGTWSGAPQSLWRVTRTKSSTFGSMLLLGKVSWALSAFIHAIQWVANCSRKMLLQVFLPNQILPLSSFIEWAVFEMLVVSLWSRSTPSYPHQGRKFNWTSCLATKLYAWGASMRPAFLSNRGWMVSTVSSIHSTFDRVFLHKVTELNVNKIRFSRIAMCGQCVPVSFILYRYLSITANYTTEWEKWWKNPEQVRTYTTKHE